MFLLEPGRTAYDLQWRMFGVHVRIHPMFWLLSAIMGFSLLRVGIPPFLIWMGCVFFSILVHELGHVFMFHVCGTDAHVVLYAFGGLAVPHRNLHNRWQRIAVSFAGPLAGFIVIAILAIALAATDVNRVRAVFNIVLAIFGIRAESPTFLGLNPLLEDAIFFLVWINLFWGLLNLLPIYPLDGGQISRDFLDGLLPRRQGVRVSLGISLVLAGLLAVHCLMAERGIKLIPFLPGGAYMAIMFAMLAVQSFQMLQQESNPPWRQDW